MSGVTIFFFGNYVIVQGVQFVLNAVYEIRANALMYSLTFCVVLTLKYSLVETDLALTGRALPIEKRYAHTMARDLNFS